MAIFKNNLVIFIQNGKKLQHDNSKERLSTFSFDRLKKAQVTYILMDLQVLNELVYTDAAFM